MFAIDSQLGQLGKCELGPILETEVWASMWRKITTSSVICGSLVSTIDSCWRKVDRKFCIYCKCVCASQHYIQFKFQLHHVLFPPFRPSLVLGCSSDAVILHYSHSTRKPPRSARRTRLLPFCRYFVRVREGSSDGMDTIQQAA